MDIASCELSAELASCELSIDYANCELSNDVATCSLDIVGAYIDTVAYGFPDGRAMGVITESGEFYAYGIIREYR